MPSFIVGTRLSPEEGGHSGVSLLMRLAPGGLLEDVQGGKELGPNGRIND